LPKESALGARKSFAAEAARLTNLPRKALLSARISQRALLLVGIVARDDGQGGFRNAEVDGLMWHVRFNQDEISFLADDRFLQLVTVARIHSAFEQVNLRRQCRFEDDALIGQICEEAGDMSKSKIAVIGGAVRSRLEYVLSQRRS
jgi:hypothetical protein